MADLELPSTSEVSQTILELSDLKKREEALKKLSDYREKFPDLAPYLWHSFGTVAILLQEVTCIYPQLNPPALSPAASNRVCSALTLF